ncbi:TRAP transporter small permease [Brucella sp. H1_1004]|uniref:TRAP transporter small permease n=1 Tax=Brucella sp. H1_1004 TaxID=3110109 RepID=UPI0039B4E59F
MTHQSDPKAGQSRTLFADLMLEEVLATIALLIVILSVTWGVVTRYVTATPASWSGELASIMFAWAVFLGSAAAFRRSGHIAIDSFLHLVPERAAYAMRILAALITFLTLFIVTCLATNFTLSTMDTPTTILRWPQAVVYAAAAVGFGAMTIRHVTASYETLFKKAAKA